MIIAVINESGHLHVFNSATGKIASGAVDAHRERQPVEPDRRLDIALGLLHDLIEKVDNMSQTQDTIRLEVDVLKVSMVELHTGITGIQSRLDTALAAAAGSTDPTVLADLHSVNDDLKTVVAALAPPAPPAQPDQPAVQADQPAAQETPAAADAPVFNSADPTPNSDGGRNSSQLPNFDPAKPETT